MDSIDIDGTPFSVLINRAVKLKTLQSKHERVLFDSYPPFYANTVFPNSNNDDVDAARQLTRFDERLVIASSLKDEGNVAFHDGRLCDARTKYEMTVSIFRYLVNTNAEWKTQGTIKDADLREMEYKCQSEVEQDELNLFLISCYNNIALVSNKLLDFTLAVIACDYSIAISNNDKAYYLRARARLGPKSSGAKEVTLARNDLTMALACNPTNAEAQKLLSRLDIDAKAQRRKDKVAFRGLFTRGVIYDHKTTGSEATTTAAAEKIPQDNVERDIILGRQLAQLYEERGMPKEKKQIELSLKQYDHARSAVNDISLDFRNPTKSMINTAKSMGVDLTDPATIALLEKLKDTDGKEQLTLDTRSVDGQSITMRPRMTRVRQYLLIIVLVVGIVWVLFSFE
jgi:tetratricopeptide (TPR) repeat protein